jgi:thymidylate synthase (FAD)
MRKSKYVPIDIHLRLRSFTEMIKATYIDHMGSDLSVVNAARVSFGKKSSAVEWGWIDIEDRSGELVAILNEQDTKLIHYLAKHKHFSPFGHAFASFHIKAPIFVARQLVKHKFLRWNEISRRYVDDEPEFYVPEVWRGRSKDKKQGSDGVVNLKKFNQYGDKYQKHYQRLKYTLEDEYDHNLSLYNALLNAGVAPEQARMVLPQSTMTEWYWSGSLDAFADMCRLRCKDDTQYETRLVADQISVVMKDLFPVSWDALMKEVE